MPPKTDIQAVIQTSINEIINEDSFIQKIAKAVRNQIEELLLTQKALYEEEINKLKLKNKEMESKIYILEQNEKRNNLRIYGVKATENENIEEKILEIFNTKMNLDITKQHIDYCYRIKNNQEASNAIFMKFTNNKIRSEVYQNKKKLKNIGINIKEDLTMANMKIYKEARMKYGYKNIWTTNGKIYGFIENSKVWLNKHFEQEDE